MSSVTSQPDELHTRPTPRNTSVALETSPQPSNKSTSSLETIKATTRRSLKQLLSTSGNNKTLPKVAKSEQVFMSGRGGARRIKKPDTPPLPTNAEILNNLIAASRTPPSPERSSSGHDDTQTISSGITSPSASSFKSKGSKAIAKIIIREVFGGGGNNSGLVLQEEFVVPYGRGGTTRPASSHRRSSDYELVSHGGSDSSLSIGRNAHGLFFFGQGRLPGSEGSAPSDYLVVGPGMGIFNRAVAHPSAALPWAAPALAAQSYGNASGMSFSMMTKITIQIACKEVLGGGGNDNGDWKYLDIFVPTFGRGGEGAKGMRILDEIFSPRRRRRRATADDSSSISFPSISSDASSVYPRSITSEGDDWMYESYQPRPSAYQDFVGSDNSTADVLRQRRLYGEHYSASPRTDAPHRGGRQGSSGPAIAHEPVHSPELIEFRNKLLEERQMRQLEKTLDVEMLAYQANESEMDTQSLGSDAGWSDLGTGSMPPIPRSAPPNLEASSRAGSGKSSHSQTTNTSALASQLALVQAQTQLFQASQVNLSAARAGPDYARLVREHADLQRERDNLKQMVAALQDEIERRERTMEGLVWLVENMPEYKGQDVSVSYEVGEMDEELLELLREAQGELSTGESRALSEQQPAIAESVFELPRD
ncbi:hypothetical protein FRB96_000495 [Tulasnella sp. 330]|nr:hypothetical protein FRB96_000495 [Tulasnella sp. 330]